jgi:helicase
VKYELPENHSLSDLVLGSLVFEEAGQPALTDVQFAALEAGIGSGESLLINSPTSTGKTQIALWAIARSIESTGSTVYLVTHRALAKQKFHDFRSQLLDTFLSGNPASLVIATGDSVEDAAGNIPAAPLRSPLLVATYEKYLALLSASGVPTDMGSTTIVCDEIQLIGDQHRGQNVEVLLTLLRNAGWKQFVGLSAVLEPKDAGDLAEWLGVNLVVEHRREKHLKYECWTSRGMAVVDSENPEAVEEGLPIPKVELEAIPILETLLKEERPPVPIIVFCMTKRSTRNLAEQFFEKHRKPQQAQLSLAFDGLPETSANVFLSEVIEHGIACHTADLTDEERDIVERRLLDGKLEVVFATSTLAAGVNFPLGAAIFAGWQRYDFDRREHVPIEASEFHNMAGRVGRMGFAHEHGRVIFAAENHMISAARQYLNLGQLPKLASRVTSERFNQLALQLVASGLCRSRTEVEKLVCGSFSAVREQTHNTASFLQWPDRIGAAIDDLITEGLLLETSLGRLTATPVGKAIGYSGLLPETGVFLLKYVASKSANLAGCLPTATNAGDILRLELLLFSACFSSPEFRSQQGKPPTRFLPYPLEDNVIFDADAYSQDLVEQVWQADPAPTNAAKITSDWVEGSEIRHLEQSAPNLSAGMLLAMFRELVWTLQGLASIATAAADERVPEICRPPILRAAGQSLRDLAKLPRIMRRLSFRVAQGLPDNALWMTGLNASDSEYRLSRAEILALVSGGMATPESAMVGSPEADAIRLKVFEKTKPAPHPKANWLRDTCRDWKSTQRQRTADRHLRRAKNCKNVELVRAYYQTTGTEFETVFESILTLLKVRFQKLDDKTKTGAPDYLIELEDSPALIVELKSKEGDNLVNYNKAVEVLAASEVHGHKETFCVTLCHPGVDPSVPLVIAACERLAVVETSDLGEALLRLCEGSLTQQQLWQWLASPGQALGSDLPFKDYQGAERCGT